MKLKRHWVAALIFAALLPAPIMASGEALQPEKTKDSQNYITASLGSHHFGKDRKGKDFNGFNPGLGLEHVRPPFWHNEQLSLRMAYATGFYLNSIDRMTVYAGVGMEACTSVKDVFSVCGGAMLGGATGYRYPVVPAGMGYLKVEHEDTGIFAKLGAIPPVQNVTPAVLTLQIGKSF